MRPQKITILIALVVLLLTALVAVMAQTPAQDPAKSADKKAESCCSDGSCPMMKKEGATANTDGTAASADMKHDCCGDSCNMKKEGAANAGCATTSADMKSADMKHDCCGDSCDMANHAKDAKHDMKHAADGSCCKAKMKDAKQKDAKDKVN
jgi:hypothetical protein